MRRVEDCGHTSRPGRGSTPRVTTNLILFMLIVVLLGTGTPGMGAQEEPATEDIVVVLPNDVDVPGILRRFALRSTYRYRRVVNGFAATVPLGVRRALEQIPGAIVSPNRRVEEADQATGEAKRCQKRHTGKKHGQEAL